MSFKTLFRDYLHVIRENDLQDEHDLFVHLAEELESKANDCYCYNDSFKKFERAIISFNKCYRIMLDNDKIDIDLEDTINETMSEMCNIILMKLLLDDDKLISAQQLNFFGIIVNLLEYPISWIDEIYSIYSWQDGILDDSNLDGKLKNVEVCLSRNINLCKNLDKLIEYYDENKMIKNLELLKNNII